MINNMTDYTDYHSKYLKYKKKYNDLKKFSLNDNLIGGAIRESSSGARKESSGLPFEITKDSDRLKEIEELMIKDLKILFDRYDLEKYLYTKNIIVDGNINNFPDSYNFVVRITRRYVLDKKYTLEHLLAIFIHEQFHCWEDQIENKTKINKLLPILYDTFPDMNLLPPYGSRTKESTYIHIIICFHEYNALIDLLGLKKANEILKTKRIYKGIYQTVIDNFDNIKDLLEANDLLS
tara:strand:+ start:1204 stop:1911 length:708 start_codon:yes stop_codon:yes gene_type:complete